MERLTTAGAKYPHGAEGVSVRQLTGNYCRGVYEATAVTERLAEYEDTGLTPEQIREIDRLYAELCQELQRYRKIETEKIPAATTTPPTIPTLYPQAPKVIEKKIHPQYFRSVRSGDKHFELRRDDDDAQINDVLYLREWDPDTKEYTGEFELRRIRYILRGVPEYGLMAGYCIVSW